MKLNDLRCQPGSFAHGKRVGRGAGSGLGKTCGRGVKGQKSRSGVAINGFEGGQMSIYRRLPKRGFVNSTAVCKASISLSSIQRAIEVNKISSSEEITLQTIVNAGIVSSTAKKVKIVFSPGFVTAANFAGINYTGSAQRAIIAAGGSISE